MTTTVGAAPGEDFAVLAGQLLAIAADLGLEPRVITITHDPHQVFVVPDEVADRLNADREAAAQPKRRRRAAAADEGPATGEEEVKADA